MENNPKIFVFQLKELIYTIIFVILAICLILLLVFMFLPKEEETDTTTTTYTSGTYSSHVIFNSVPMEVSVKLDSNHINAIDFIPLSEDITTTSPLMQNCIDNIEKQVLFNQSTLNLNSYEENQYTYAILAHAIDTAINKATR
ncbi:MAG: hypothetical protein J6L69_10755 [Lachnospiraceae bacterium]|nr:hypothetical protein [Lachnospiraceae bacterium]